MKQKDLIQRLLTIPKTVKQLFEEAGILRPNVRRILHQGVKKGEFVRLGRGVYACSIHGERECYVLHADAEPSLQMMEGRFTFDSIFLDIPYYSYQLIGRNRRKKNDQYDFLQPEKFGVIMSSVSRLLASDGVVWLMLSGAPSASKDMWKYLAIMRMKGFKLVEKVHYQKTYKSGKPVINIRGVEAACENLYCFVKMDWREEELAPMPPRGRVYGPEPVTVSFVRPRGYNTEKPYGLIELIMKGARRLLDPFAGSGVVGEYAVRNNCFCVLIEKSEKAVYEHILPRLKNLLK